MARKTLWALLLTGLTFVVELLGGFYTGSVALLADSGHAFADALSLGLGLLAMSLAGKPVSLTRTYGWHRAEIFAALINGILVLAAAWAIWVRALRRFLDPVAILAPQLLVIASFGLVMNLIVVYWLHQESRRDVNIKGMWLHVLSDTVSSGVVIISGLLILAGLPGWLDPLAGFGVGLFICFPAFRLIRDSLHTLFEGVPRDLKIEEVQRRMKSVRGVRSVSDLHIWSLCSHMTTLSAHLLLEDREGDRRKIIDRVHKTLLNDFSIQHTTLQID